MKIYLKSLTLTNFKGIRSLQVNLKEVTNIHGDNATGKTTLMDAFLWLLFGKDSTDRKDFEIKTLDDNNQPFHRLDHEVEGVMNVDGAEINLRRSYKEKWVKKRGAIDTEFAGHETTYFWNDVPMKQDEYQAKIAGLLNENIFKLITNTTYFNSMKWQDRRGVLMQIAGEINDADILDKMATVNNKTEIGILTNALNQGKTFEEYKREITAKKKKIKDELLLLPSRIDEASRSLPDEVDYSAIDELIASVIGDIDNVDGLLQNKSKATQDYQTYINDLLQKRQNFSRQMMDLEHDIKNQVAARKMERESKIQKEKSELRSLNDSIAITRNEYSTANKRKEWLQDDQKTLREMWSEVDAKKLEFKEGEFCCPTCKREYEASDVEAKKKELTANFNLAKSNQLDNITEKGSTHGKEIEDLETKLSNLKAEGEKLNAAIDTLSNRIKELEIENNRLCENDEQEVEKAIATNEQYQTYKAEVNGLNDLINAPYTGEDNSSLLQRKRELNQQLDELKAKLTTKGQREKQQERITELQGQESKMAQELATLEGIEFSIDQFTRAKMDELESRINGRFKIVRFKMFEEQINGGQVEACTTLINGVPYSDANTAAKIQAGLDIINVLNDHYGVEAPVWVDNRESVVTLPETNCQLINLIVSAPDKKLRIESAALEAVA